MLTPLLLLLSVSALARDNIPVLTPKLVHPLISEPLGNQHLVALEAGDEGMDVIHFTNSTRQFDRSRIPWDTLLERKVQYSIPAFYRIGEPEPGFKLDTAKKHAKMRYKLKLPPAHVLIDYTERDGMLYFATSSDQGYRDGEMDAPFNTVQVFAHPLGKIHRNK